MSKNITVPLESWSDLCHALKVMPDGLPDEVERVVRKAQTLARALDSARRKLTALERAGYVKVVRTETVEYFRTQS